MPGGPKGERRPADVIGNAVHVMRIAIGKIKDEVPGKGVRKSVAASVAIVSTLWHLKTLAESLGPAPSLIKEGFKPFWSDDFDRVCRPRVYR